MENKSEVAILRKRIEEEYIAARRALYSPAIISIHDFITARMEGMQQAHAKLETILGPDEAIKQVADVLKYLPE